MTEVRVPQEVIGRMAVELFGGPWHGVSLNVCVFRDGRGCFMPEDLFIPTESQFALYRAGEIGSYYFTLMVQDIEGY